MTGPATLMRKLRGKARRISRELAYEEIFLQALERTQRILNGHNQAILTPLYRLPQPKKHKGWFDWTVLFENRGTEEERKQIVLSCLQFEIWDRTDPGLVIFLHNLLHNIK